MKLVKLFATAIVLATLGCGGHTPQPAQTAPTPDISGYWSGSIKAKDPLSAAKGSLLLVLTETGDTVSGTSKVENHCFDEFSITGQLTGHLLVATILTDDGGKINLTAAVYLDASNTPARIEAKYQIVSGACTGDTGTITFIRPKALPV